MARRVVVTTLVAGAAFLVGALLGGAATLIHQYAWGLALGLAAGMAVLLALPRWWWVRLAMALGWGLSVWLAMRTTSAGDYLVPANLPGYGFLAGSLALLVIALATSRTRASVATMPGESPSST